MPTNPFSTRFTRPGAIPFVFPPGINAASLVQRLAALGWWGEIVGPHGSGKSTLLAGLRPELLNAGRTLIDIELHDGQRRLPIELSSLPDVSPSMQFLVDGYEQLGWLARTKLRWFCRRHGCGLLVTSHQSVGLPPLFRTSVDAELAMTIVRTLLLDHDKPFTADEIAARLELHRGNLRETLFDLYDRHERRR